MRAITSGSFVLLFAVVLLSWDASRRFMHVPQPAHEPSSGIGNASAIQGALSSRISAVPEGEAARTVMPARGSLEAALPPPATRSESGVAVQAAGETAPARAQSRLPPGVRQLTPGSKAHAEAIASALASEEYRNAAEPVARLYFAFFDRAADLEGFNYYIEERDAGLTLEAMAEEFAGSEEFRLRYGALDNAAFFDRVYRNVFDGVADASLRAAWIAQLDAGMSRGQLMVAFSESNAFRAATSNEVFVTMAYAEALGREPDPAGLARWVRFLDAGNPRDAVIAGLLGSARAKR